MKTFFQTVKNYWLISIVISIIMGAVLLIYPEQSIKYISLAVGCTIICFGVLAAIDYFVKNKSAYMLASGIVLMAFGVFVCIKYKTIISLIEILFGIFILCGGVVNFATSIEAARKKNASWMVTILLSVAAIVFGILSIIQPFSVSTTLVRFIGIGLFIYAVLGIVSYFQFISIEKAITQAQMRDKEIIVDDAVVVESQEM